MKIVLSTDFTEASYNAIEYVTRLFWKQKDQVEYYLVHAYRPMSTYSYTANIPVLQNEAWQDESRKRLMDEADELQFKLGVKIFPTFEIGGVSEVVEEIEENEHPDLVVMGSTEKSLFERITLGSNVIQVVENIHTPLLIIPKEAKYKPLTKIVFTTDLKPLGVEKGNLEMLKRLLKDNHAKLQVLHIFSSAKGEERKAIEMIRHHFGALDYELHPSGNPSVIDGIINFIEHQKPDLLTMIPRNKNFIEKLMGKSVTKKMTYESPIPLLIMK